MCLAATVEHMFDETTTLDGPRNLFPKHRVTCGRLKDYTLRETIPIALIYFSVAPSAVPSTESRQAGAVRQES